METYCKQEEAREGTLNLITHVQADPAHESDANALIPAIESTKERGLAPEEVLADSLYGSDKNCQEAEQPPTSLAGKLLPTPGRLGGSKYHLMLLRKARWQGLDQCSIFLGP